VSTQKQKIERRVVAVDGLELREGPGDGSGQRYVEGVGVVYDREVELWPGYFETIRAGALTRALKAGDEIKCFFNHEPNMVLATTRSKPALELFDEPGGLRFKAPVPPTSYGRDLEANLERRNVRGASFAFMVDYRGEDDPGDTVIRDEKGNYHREITRAILYEVGPVTNPAYPQTKAKLRDAGELFAEAEERCKVEAKESAAGEKNGINVKKEILSLLERGV
jgi:HK97 family phage prohead protease